MKKMVLLLFCAGLGAAPPLIAFTLGEHVATADPAPDAGAIGATPAPPAAGSAVTLPSDKIHDPLDAPAATYSDFQAARRVGWGIAALFVAIVLCRLLARLGGIFKPLGEGRASLVIGLAGVLALTAYNAMLSGGTWLAALLASVVAGFAYWDSRASPKKPAPA